MACKIVKEETEQKNNKPLNDVTMFGKLLNCPKALEPVKYIFGEAMATNNWVSWASLFYRMTVCCEYKASTDGDKELCLRGKIGTIN